MALRFTDSFDHYGTGNVGALKWSVITDGNIVTVSDLIPRTGARSLTVSGGGNYYAGKTLDSQATWIIGVAVRLAYVGGNSGLLLSIVDGTTVQVDVRLTASGTLQVTRNGTVLATGTTVLSSFIYYYLELKATINSTTGSYELRINGTSEVSGSGVNTSATGSASANQVRLHPNLSGPITGHPVYYDDVYICDGTGGAPNNDFLGDCKVECLFPGGNGNSSQFDGSDGNQVDNYLLVDETTMDEDATYVQSPDVNDKDTYAYGDLVTTSGTVYGLQVLPRLRKTDAGSRTAVSVARLAGGTEADSAAKVVYDSYLYAPDIRETKPGGGAWAIADVNGAEFGIKVNS